MILAMFDSGSWVKFLSGTCFISLACAMTSMGMEVPNSGDAPVDIISPVPAPEVDGINAASIEMPEELRITN